MTVVVVLGKGIMWGICKYQEPDYRSSILLLWGERILINYDVSCFSALHQSLSLVSSGSLTVRFHFVFHWCSDTQLYYIICCLAHAWHIRRLRAVWGNLHALIISVSIDYVMDLIWKIKDFLYRLTSPFCECELPCISLVFCRSPLFITFDTL